jgi:hypothetical protein
MPSRSSNGYRKRPLVASRVSRLTGHRMTRSGSGRSRTRGASSLLRCRASPRWLRRAASCKRAPPRARSDGVAVHDLRGALASCDRARSTLTWARAVELARGGTNRCWLIRAAPTCDGACSSARSSRGDPAFCYLTDMAAGSPCCVRSPSPSISLRTADLDRPAATPRTGALRAASRRSGRGCASRRRPSRTRSGRRPRWTSARSGPSRHRRWRRRS